MHMKIQRKNQQNDIILGTSQVDEVYLNEKEPSQETGLIKTLFHMFTD